MPACRRAGIRGGRDTPWLPAMVRLLAGPPCVRVADAMIDDPRQRLWLLGHEARQFGLEIGNLAHGLIRYETVHSESRTAPVSGGLAEEGRVGLTAMEASINPKLPPLLEFRQTASRGRVSQPALLSCLGV